MCVCDTHGECPMVRHFLVLFPKGAQPLLVTVTPRSTLSLLFLNLYINKFHVAFVNTSSRCFSRKGWDFLLDF